ncbi:uncharacterized protein PG998_012121 [Apiospora kogelbergensis]|uniref:uncharacterized protein n=1 Tax=Apiospora kogelbergensis TaxID=1337665 RepID=UPI0031326D08
MGRVGTTFWQVLVNLTVAELDKSLDGPIYFQKHTSEKEAILRQLNKISSTSFDLQQILYDLEHAALVALPAIEGIEEGSTPEYLLTRYFINVYAKHCQAEGLPLAAVTATPQSPDPSQLQMTSFQRQVSHLKDDKGNVIANPDMEEQAVTTLDFLCVTDGKPMPGSASFGWNWVEKNEVKGSWEYWVPVYRVSLSRDGAPDSVDVGSFTDATQVIQVNYHRYITDSDSYGLYSADFNITTDYTVKAYFHGTTIKIEQEYRVHMYLRAANNNDELTVYDPKRTDWYDISVGQYGDLNVVWRDFDTADGSEQPHTGWFIDLFVPLNEIIDDIKDDIEDMGPINLEPINFDTLQSFIFPGSKTFAFKSPVFSDYQDLLCKITYVNPSESHVTQAQLCDGARSQGHTLAQGDFPAQKGLTLTYSSDMLDNYVQGEIVSPYSKFEALQTDDGHALLFAIDTSGVFHVIKEQSGTSSNGWQFEDLSSAVIVHWYVDVDSAEARTFDVGQSAVNGTINVALAISDGGIDTLFVSLGNDSSNVDWTTSPEWTRIPFDDALEHPTALKIVSVMFVETSNNQEYLVVDIDRPTSTESSKQCIARYHIDLSKTSGSYWVKNDVPVDIEDGSYKSTVGRVSNGRVDGVYTSGFSGKTPQLVYVPVENIYGSGPPEPRRLRLPDSTPTYAIAASRYGSQTSKLFQLTDLFCVGGSTLYRFAADKQSDGSKASPLITNDCLSGTNQLQATMGDGFVTICGKNGNDQLYYTSCPASQVDQPGSWSVVVPILSGVEQFSTYINKADGGNTVFASGGGKLFKLTQSTATGAKMWRPQEITLAVPAVEKPLPFNSYTTTIHISNEDNLPAANVELEISADALTPFYINGLYYLVGPKPVLVSTSSLGIATVVEAVVGLNATIITVSI